MTSGGHVFESLVTHRRPAMLVLLAVVLGVSAGVVVLESASGIEAFDLGTEEEAKLDDIESQFTAHEGDREVAQVVLRDDNALDRETLIASLQLQRDIRADERIRPTLDDERPTVGLANVVATAVIQESVGIANPSLELQIAVLAGMDEEQVASVVSRVLGGGKESDGRGGGPDGSDSAGAVVDQDVLAFVPTAYEPGSAEAESTMLVVFQTVPGEYAPADAPAEVVESHLAIQELAANSHDDALVVGNGLVTDEEQRALGDTMAVVGPAALLLVLLVLVLAYRDVLDVLLGLAGILAVQLWTFGALGWLGMAFNPVLVAVPVMLIGLAIDYCIHVFMRYREHRADGAGVEAAMSAGLAGVGVALVWVTVTTAIGFLSNGASPMEPVRELGVIAAIGILGSFVVFGLFVPLVKVELDAGLERVGVDRATPPIGAGDGVVARVLSVGATAARTAPVAVVLLTVVLTAGTAVAATNVSTTWGPEENMVDGAPAWTAQLPSDVQPGTYTVRDNIRYVNANYVRHGSDVDVLVEGDVTRPDTLERQAAARDNAAVQEVVVLLANGEPRVQSPLSVVHQVAGEDDGFAETVSAADTTGDGIPDQNIERVYDHLFDVAPERASKVLLRNERGEYVAYRLSVSVDPGAEGTGPADQLEAAADTLDHDGVTVTVTGRPVVAGIVQQTLQETLVVSFLITLLAVVSVLAIVFRLVQDSATLGIVTILPVVAAVSWILGTMYVLGYPLSVLNVIVASLTVGIGIDYSIHVTERFRSELRESGDVDEAVTTTVRGTGGALLGSATTTAAGFGVLTLAIHPPLQQFGTITAIMIGYAFLGSVLVLPSLLVIWARLVGADTASSDAIAPSASELTR